MLSTRRTPTQRPDALSALRLIDIDRALSARLVNFVRVAWPILEPGAQSYVHNWHIDAMCEHLEAVTRGEISRLVINVPPGMMKSMLVNIFWPAWEWGPQNRAETRYVCASHHVRLSERDSVKMRRLLLSQWFQDLWPLALVEDQNQKGYFENEKTGYRQACPLVSMTGHRGDRVILDDPQSIEMAYSPAQTAESIRIFRETVPTRLNNPSTSAIILIMQRLATNDITAQALELWPDAVLLCLPMEYVPSKRCATRIGFTDPRTAKDELLFESRFPRDYVTGLKKSLGSYGASAQLQLDPIPLGGRLFDVAKFGAYKIVPKLRYRKIYADTAQKTAEHNDYSVFLVAGLGYDNRVYILDVLRDKWTAPNLDKTARALWAKHKALNGGDLGAMRAMVIEDASSGSSLIQNLQTTEPRVLVSPIKRTKDKLTRWMDAHPHIEAGDVMLPSDAPWLSDFLRECQDLAPNDTHPHDDQVDALCDAISDMLGSDKTKPWEGLA